MKNESDVWYDNIPRSGYNFIFFDLTLLKATAVKPARPRLDFDGLIL